MMVIVSIGLVILAGGIWLAGQSPDEASASRLRAAMAVGTGFTLAMLVAELLPETWDIARDHGHGAWTAMAATAVAVWALDHWAGPVLTRRLSPAGGHDHDHGEACCSASVLGHGAACSAVGCLLVCLFVDGAALKASLAAGSALSGMVTLSLVLHLLPEALIGVTMMQAAGASGGAVRQTAWLAAAAFGLGGLLPLEVLPAQHLLVPATAGILLMVNLLHLIPAVNVSRPARWLMVAGGVGFVMIERLAALPPGA